MRVLDRFRLDGRTALVTGASRGLGAAMARALAQAGAHVAIHASRPLTPEGAHELREDATRYDDAITARIPAGRWGEPDDLAGSVVVLASRASDDVHASMLVVDGGWLAR